MDSSRILAQSKAAYGQWCVQWREHAKINSKCEMKSLTDLEFSGVGKPILCVANGYSFEENIETIKKYKHVDIMACDKTFGHLVENGIKPKYVMVCDANVNFEKYLEPYLDSTSETTLFSNVCANPKWIHGVDWKDKYFFVNKDIIQSEKEFSEISGCKNIIPAATNVSNAMVVLLTQSDNNGRRNFFGYDKIVLVGFDYCWRFGKSYYAFDKRAGEKIDYMCHAYLTTEVGSFAYTSGNLAFSAEWLSTYVRTFKLPVVQATRETLTKGFPHADLEDQLKYSYKEKDADKIKKLVTTLRSVSQQKQEIEFLLNEMGKEHWFQHIATS